MIYLVYNTRFRTHYFLIFSLIPQPLDQAVISQKHFRLEQLLFSKIKHYDWMLQVT